jgi:hypothetical protein
MDYLGVMLGLRASTPYCAWRYAVMDSDLANIGLICLLMGVGIVLFIGIAFAYLAAMEFIETWYLKD